MGTNRIYGPAMPEPEPAAAAPQVTNKKEEKDKKSD